MKVSDPRSLRSREALRGALLRLVAEQPFERITLRQITAEAGVSYPTFFNHYEDKEALFHEIARVAILELIDAFRQGRLAPGWRPGLDIATYVAGEQALWRTLLTAGAAEAMRSEFIRRGRDLARGSNPLGHGFAIDLVSGVIASGIFEIIAWWLAQGEEQPVETVADMLETLVIEPALGLRRGAFASG